MGNICNRTPIGFDKALQRELNFLRSTMCAFTQGGGGGGDEWANGGTVVMTDNITIDQGTSNNIQFVYDHGDGHQGGWSFKAGDEGIYAAVTNGTSTMSQDMSYDAGYRFVFQDGSGNSSNLQLSSTQARMFFNDNQIRASAEGIIATLDNTSTFETSYDHGDGHGGIMKFESDNEGLNVNIEDGTTEMRMRMSFDAGYYFQFNNGVDPSVRVNLNETGFNYNEDISALFTDDSLINKGFADATYAPIGGGGLTIDSTTITGGTTNYVLFQKSDGTVTQNNNLQFNPATGQLSTFLFSSPGGGLSTNGGATVISGAYTLQFDSGSKIKPYQQPLTILRSYTLNDGDSSLIVDNDTANTVPSIYHIADFKLSGTIVAFIDKTGRPSFTVQNFATNALAILGGLAIGDVYRNADILQIVH